MSRTDVSGQIGCHETSMNTYKSTLRNTTEDRGSRLHRSGSLKSRKQFLMFSKIVQITPFPLLMFSKILQITPFPLLMFSKIVQITPFSLKEARISTYVQMVKKLGHRLSCVQIEVLQYMLSPLYAQKSGSFLPKLPRQQSPLNYGIVLPNYTTSLPKTVILKNYIRCRELIYYYQLRGVGASGDAVGWGTARQAGRSQFRFPIESLEIFIDIILPVTPCLWGRPSL